MAKWPDIQTWSLEQLVRLKASWQQIQPENAAQKAALDASMREVEDAIRRQSTGDGQAPPA